MNRATWFHLINSALYGNEIDTQFPIRVDKRTVESIKKLLANRRKKIQGHVDLLTLLIEEADELDNQSSNEPSPSPLSGIKTSDIPSWGKKVKVKRKWYEIL